MSALPAPSSRPQGSSAATRERHLTVVPRGATRLARVPFLIVLGVVMALGMVGILVMNVTIQQQSSRLDSLQATDTDLSNQQAALQAKVDSLSSTTSLTSAAYKLGLRPNPTPAFIQLPSGKIVGTPSRVTGSELPDQSPQTVTQQAAAIAAALKAKAAASAAAKASAQASASAAAKAASASASAKAASASAKASATATSTATPTATSTATTGGH